MPPVDNSKLRTLVTDYVQAGRSGPEIINLLARVHDIHISPRTLSRRRAEWSLKKLLPAADSDAINEAIAEYHKQGQHLDEIIITLKNRHGYSISQRTLQRRLADLGLHRKKDDLDLERCSVAEVALAIKHAKDGKYGNAGYRKMQAVLRSQYGMRIHRDQVYAMVKEYDPVGTEQRRKDSLKRRTTCEPGSNHP